jgi:hypothetical protein
VSRVLARPLGAVAVGDRLSSWVGPTRTIVVEGPEPQLALIIPAGSVVHDVPIDVDARELAKSLGGYVAVVFADAEDA